MNKYEEEYRELEEAYKEVMDYISHDDPSKEKKRAMLFLQDKFLEVNAKVEAIEKVLELLKQKRESAYNDYKNLKCEKENVGMHIALKNQIDTYTDCIITIETEMGRGKK